LSSPSLTNITNHKSTISASIAILRDLEKITLRAIYKRRPHKTRKTDPLPLSSKCPHRFNPSPTLPFLSVQTLYKFRKVRSFLHHKVRTSASEEPLVRKMSALDNPLTAYGQPLNLTFGTGTKFTILITLTKILSEVWYSWLPKNNMTER